MKNTQKEQNVYWIIFLFVGMIMGASISFFILSGETIEKIVTIEIEKEQPMLSIQIIDWYENEFDASERIMDYYIMNYGNIEAKNVTITCTIENSIGIEKNSQIYQIGNIASNSYEFQESIIKGVGLWMDGDVGECEITSADEDYINLKDRLVDLE